MEVSQKIENKTTAWSSNSSSGNFSKNKTLIWKGLWALMFTAALFINTIAKI